MNFPLQVEHPKGQLAGSELRREDITEMEEVGGRQAAKDPLECMVSKWMKWGQTW